MARGAQPITLGLGLGAAAVLVALSLGTLAAVVWRAEGPGGLGPADWAAVRFTLLQASLSAGLSVGLAIPVARALARRRFPGRGLLVTLLGAPFILPVIVAILGLLAVFGRNGILSQGLGLFGLPPVQIYGLHGVVLAHVFFNLPLATRLLLQGWMAIPAEQFRLAGALGFGPREVFQHLEWPMLRALVPGALVVVFLICLTSFAVALALGGGPRATTVELAIYQAFRFEFDLAKAAQLAGVQCVLSGLAALLAVRVAVPQTFGGGRDRPVARWDAGAVGLRVLDTAVLAAVALFLLLPLAMVAAAGLGTLLTLPVAVWQAAGASIVVALLATGLTLMLALPLALLVVRAGRAGAVVELVGALSIAASPLVMGTGLFILLFPVADPASLALPVTALVNAALSVPFALRALVPAVREIDARFAPLAASLGLSERAALRLVVLPRLRRPLGFAAGLAAALAMGDLGVIALFADPETATLPLALYRLMAAYRMDEAAGAGLLLLGLSLGAFWLFDRGGRLGTGA